MNTNPTSRKSRLRSIRFQLVLAVNGVLFLFVLGFLTFDYARQLGERLDDKKTALQEEAKTLLPGVLHLQGHGPETIQRYVDDVCGRMDDADSHSHHIAVELDGVLIQAHAHHRQSDELVEAMKRAADNDQQRIRTADHDLVVGVQQQGSAIVLVSEDVSGVRAQVFNDEMRRMLALVLMGLISAAVVNVVLVRVVSRPLQTLVDKVREVGEGTFSTTLETYGSDELNYLSAEINSMSDALEESERRRQVRLDKARDVQENLLPKNLGDITGIDIGRLYCPAEEVGGDFFDILSMGRNRWLVCMADATDHGVPAAMSAAMLKTLLLQAKGFSRSPGRMLAIMNSPFMRVHLYGDFASIILIHLDLEKHELTYANAGHDPAWLIEPGGKVSELEATGTLLGIDEESVWEEKMISFKEGWRLAIATDGITETFDVENLAFGKQRLLDDLLCSGDTPAQHTVDKIHEEVRKFRGSKPQLDDVTLLVLDFVLQHEGQAERADSSPPIAARGS